MIVRGTPRCDGLDTTQDTGCCPTMVAWRVSHRFRKVDGSVGTMTAHSCRRHFAGFLDKADRTVAVHRYRDPQWPAPEVVAVELQVTGRDRAHGRPGRFLEVGPEGPAEPLQLSLL